jgi:hypothetical protein
MLYRVSFTYEHGTHGGYEWFTNRRQADRVARTYRKLPAEDATVESFDVPKGKRAIVDFLNRVASAANNG